MNWDERDERDMQEGLDKEDGVMEVFPEGEDDVFETAVVDHFEEEKQDESDKSLEELMLEQGALDEDSGGTEELGEGALIPEEDYLQEHTDEPETPFHPVSDGELGEPTGTGETDGIGGDSYPQENAEEQQEPEGDEEPVEEEEVVDDEEANELKEMAQRLKEEMGKPDVVSAVNFAMVDNEGNIMDTRKRGKIDVRVLNIETDIIRTRRVRTTPQDLFSLQEQLRKFGQLEPIHVVEYGDKYLLLHGYRRLQASVNIGNRDILAYVDSTIPAEMVKYFEPMVNSVAPYTFTEKMEYGKFFKETQKDVGYDVIEGILGLRTGDFLKGLYIDTMKPEFMDVYTQVEKNKITIEQAFKKIEKEIEKREKEETSGMDALNSGELDDQLRNTNELNEISGDAGKQELGNRKILDPVIRRSVESRDGGYCQCCGYGEGEPDFMGVFNVHHIIAVQYGGSDNKSNLILLCSNCHKLVHDFETGRFLPEKATYDRRSDVKKIVILGNMLQKTRKRAIEELRRRHEAIGCQMDAGKITIGQALQKAEVDVKGEEYFNNSPYQMFMDNVDNLKFGGKVAEELGEIDWGAGDEGEPLDANEFGDVPVSLGDEAVSTETDAPVSDTELVE